MKVSIIIPILNEINYLRQCLDSIINNTTIIDNTEILLIDGGSKDGTIEIINEYVSKYKNIKYYKNLRGITPAALNIGLLNSSGLYIVRLDAHAKYQNHYIDECVSELENADSSVLNVGGTIKTTPGGEKSVSKAIAYVLSSLIGVGNSFFRTSKLDSYKFVETVPFGCFRRSVIDIVGLFNEEEPRNEDLEYNKRIIKSGRKILCSNKISSEYYARQTVKGFLKQAFNNGFIVTNKSRGDNSFHNLRHFIPFLFVIYFILSLFLFVFFDNIASDLIAYSWIFYLLIVYFFSILSFVRKGGFLIHTTIFPVIVFLLHLFYGVGSVFGAFYYLSSKVGK